MESWSGFWSGIYSVIVALHGQELVLINQFLVNAYFYKALSFYSLCFFCHVSLTCILISLIMYLISQSKRLWSRVFVEKIGLHKL